MSSVQVVIVVVCIITMWIAIIVQHLIWLKIVEKVNSTRSLEQQIIPRTIFLSYDERIKQTRIIFSEYRKLYPAGRLIRHYMICLNCACAAMSIAAGFSGSIPAAVFIALFGFLGIWFYQRAFFPRA
jgi:hypothetical protein